MQIVIKLWSTNLDNYAKEALKLYEKIWTNTIQNLHYSEKFVFWHFIIEFVLDLSEFKKETGVSALDIAKSLIDRGMHPPTMYFPLIVHEALMLEPTETESKETLDMAAEVFHDLYKQAHTNAESMHSAPHNAYIGRPDEVRAARTPVLQKKL